MNKLKLFSFFKKHPALIFLLVILALAAFFRFWDLAQIPPGLYPDVAINGNDALNALRTGDFKVFYPENNGREGFFINLIALSFWIFGPSVWAIKFVAALIGFLTVLGMYFLTKEMFRYLFGIAEHVPSRSDGSPPKAGFLAMTMPEIIALLSTFFLAISFWHVNFSRIGFRAIMVPFCLVWSFYFLFKAIQATPILESSASKLKIFVYFALAGAFFGLGFHTYIAFRVAPLILAPVFLVSLIKFWPDLKQGLKKRNIFKIYWRKGWFGWDIFLFFLILAVLPIALYYFQHPADFLGRSGQVSIFAADNPLKTLAQSTIKTLGQFLVFGDANWRHNLSGSPQIFWPLIPFFLIGLFWFIRQIFRRKNYQKENLWSLAIYWTVLLWFGAMLLPAIMTNEGLPHALRTIGAIIPAYIFTGFGFYLIISWIYSYLLSSSRKRGSRLTQNIDSRFRGNDIRLGLFYILIFAFLIIIAGFSFYNYFIKWGQNLETHGAFTQQFTDEANYLNSLPRQVQKYVLVNETGVAVPYPDGIPIPAQTIIFLTQGKTDIKYLTPDPQSISFLSPGPTVILPMRIDEKIFDELKQKIPQGEIDKQKDFWVFKIGF